MMRVVSPLPVVVLVLVEPRVEFGEARPFVPARAAVVLCLDEVVRTFAGEDVGQTVAEAAPGTAVGAVDGSDPLGGHDLKSWI